MSECPKTGEVIEKIVAGETARSERDRLSEHAAACAACHEVVELERGLHRAGADVPSPAEAEFRAMRTRVLARLAERPQAAAAGLWPMLLALFRAQPLAASLLLAVALGAAALAGRSTAASPHGIDQLLLQALHDQARAGSGVAGYWDAPLTYRNVTARPAGEGRLRLSFDATWHVDTVAERASDLTTEVLLHALLDSSRLSTRLKAMQVADDMLNARLREGVVFALHEDPDLAVRLQALALLASSPWDAAVEEALLTTLRRDAAVQMRLRALEELAAKHVGQDLLRRTILAGGLDSDSAVLRRASAAGGEY